MTYVILQGNCLDVLKTIPENRIDMVLADVPYGQTQNAWDIPIPFEPMWQQLRRVAKQDASIVLMAAQPFAAKLICSNLDDFRYDLIWRKNKPTGFLNAKKQPLRNHEHILVFYRRQPAYVPQMTNGHKPGNYARRTKHSTNYGAQKPTEYGGSTERYPLSVIDMPIINNDDPDKHHPTQKPVDLMAQLIQSFTQPGQLVLDFAAGSGTTALAAERTGRHSISIELNPDYVTMARARVEAARKDLT